MLTLLGLPVPLTLEPEQARSRLFDYHHDVATSGGHRRDLPFTRRESAPMSGGCQRVGLRPSGEALDIVLLEVSGSSAET